MEDIKSRVSRVIKADEDNAGEDGEESKENETKNKDQDDGSDIDDAVSTVRRFTTLYSIVLHCYFKELTPSTNVLHQYRYHKLL